MEAEVGLSTKEALSRLCATLGSEIDKERERLLAADPLAFRYCTVARTSWRPTPSDFMGNELEVGLYPSQFAKTAKLL